MFFNAFIANAFKNNSFVQHTKLLLYIFRYLYFIKRLMLKIYYFITLNAPKMVMRLGVWVKTFRLAKSLNHSNNSDFSKGQKRSVYGIEGDLRKDFSYLIEYAAGIRVIL